MITNNDSVAAILDRKLYILRRQDTLNPNLHLRHASEPGDLPRP
jgi:hypothetical protein